MRSSTELPTPMCIGCKKDIEEGSVIAFGDALFHLDCFHCAKCSRPVDCSSNLLLLTDGRPICEDCSYVCVACKQAIRDEAVMTGDEAYHANCFRCCSCKLKIDDLVFTQTSKGIFCTPCNEYRKAQKQRKRDERDQRRKQGNGLTQPTPSTSSPSAAGVSPNTSASDIPSLNLSFFDNDSGDLLNLSESLGANLAAGTSQNNNSWNDFPLPPTSRGLRQSPSLMSLRSMESFRQNTTITTTTTTSSNHETSVLKLQADLKAANAKITELSKNYNKIKEASARALDEFSKAKDDFNKEVTLRHQCEFTILHLQQQLTSQRHSGSNGNSSPLDKDEIERLAELRVGLEQACNELRSTRDAIATEIENLAKQEQGSCQFKALEVEVKSLKQERDSLKAETRNLSQLRDDVINEMVILQSQNAELTTMNNDLTRRRKSSEASLDIRTVSSRDSFNGTQAPKLFKMKKSSSNMFARFANKGKSDVSSSGASIYSMQNASYSTQSLMNDHPPSRREVRQGSKQSNHSGLQLSGSPPTTSSFHSFQVTAFIRPVKCGVCFEKMWGLSEYRCQGCALSIHGKCLSHAPQLCFAATSSSLDLLASPADSIPPVSMKEPTMFGYDLGLQALAEDRSVPLIVEKCIAAVELRGMDYEGIYRKSGGAAQMRAIQAAFDKDSQSVDLADDELYNDICSVTSVLKQYLRELPNPLLTFDLYGPFIEAVSSQSNHDRFRELLSQLPKSNYDTLKLLLQHLYRVSKNSQENRMTSKNLALVFAPTIIRDKDSSRDLLDMSYTNALMEYLISSANDLFDPVESSNHEEI
ncbi:hypothetical protein BX666DRAFT_1853030 [Dichotomocladium elegans]|nr:hypothetical protein BX666DRAFT_1853030 [Dichotomocladium elegans]